MQYEIFWQPKSSEDLLAMDIGLAVEMEGKKIVGDNAPELAQFFPFNPFWIAGAVVKSDYICFKMFFEPGFSPRMQDDSIITGSIIERFPSENSKFFEYRDLKRIFGAFGFSRKSFIYFGPRREGKLSWAHIHYILLEWMNDFLVPEVHRENEARIRRVVPPSPSYEVGRILSSLWVLECEEELIQGTAFELSGVGLVSCCHVLGKETRAFRAEKFKEKFNTRVVSYNAEIDLAILELDAPLDNGLARGSAQNLQQLDHIAVSGFPNYRYGDSGVFAPGLVTGFRVFSGIRRIMTDAPIVSGNSGGPVVDRNGEVIGVAATGAERMDLAHLTEKHGLIPIDALDLLK